MKNDNHKWDNKHPTAQMLGRWQPWHAGHTQLFRKIHSMTGQVAIMVRNVPSNTEANQRVPGQDDNPFSFEEISDDISKKLDLLGYKVNVDFIIQFVPNITNITYGRGVGYKIEEESFNSDIESISATKIRKNLRDEGKIK